MTTHYVFTTNGLRPACAAAAVLLKYPDAELAFSSSRHLPIALDDIRKKGVRGTLHIVGMGFDTPVEEIVDGLKNLKGWKVNWYAGAAHPEMKQHTRKLSAHCTLVHDAKHSDVHCVLRALHLSKHPGAALLRRLDEGDDASDEHAQWNNLILASNEHFYYFGDDSLNMRSIRCLAGLEDLTSDLKKLAREYSRSEEQLFPLGSSTKMKRLRKEVGQFGPVPEPVLILGPTGAGKELVARSLHVTSKRKGRFIALNCAILGSTPNLAEDRLFGHTKGAFTGATSDKKGAFEQAHEGTLFLDEIGELSPEIQAHLLRVLQEGVVTPMGSLQEKAVDVRVIAATHRDLYKRVRDGAFREDLFYRINVLCIAVPPLRERKQDMRSIANRLKQQLASQGYTLKLSKSDWESIDQHDWPGNVREFINTLKRAAYTKSAVGGCISQESTQRLKDTDCHSSLYFPQHKSDVRPVKEINAAYVNQVLTLFDGNITQAAKALDIASNTLRKSLVF